MATEFIIICLLFVIAVVAFISAVRTPPLDSGSPEHSERDVTNIWWSGGGRGRG
jgi:hypothetical protein